MSTNNPPATAAQSAGCHANANHEQEKTAQDASESTDEEGSESTGSNLSLNVPSDLPRTSVVQYLGPSSSYCGYCKRSEQQSGSGRRSYDMQTYSLLAADYQALLDRNWRRSGTYSYRPINQKTCCPNYSITCTATKFHLTRSQRKCIAKVNSYLATGEVRRDINLDFSKDPTCDRETSKKKVKSLDEIRSSSKLRAKRFLRSCERKARQHGKTLAEAANDLREKWDNKLQSRLPLESYLYPKRVTLVGDDVTKDSFKAKHVLKIDMVHVDSERSRASREDQHQMVVRYQKAVHKESEWSMSRFCSFLVESPLITERLENFDYLPREPSEENDSLSQDLHLADADEYLLVRPPQLPTAYGTYHCNYYLDNKLIATGVLDVLPKCITTVYFFYDPDYDFLNLGIYSALVEISMIRQMDKHYINSGDTSENQLVNYYLGFYVHVCKKMHYKTRFRPAYLLCSKALCYVPIDICLKKLSDGNYADFSDQPPPPGDNVTHLSSSIAWFSIPIVPPIDGLDSTMKSYVAWLTTNLGLEYLDLFLNGYLVAYAKLIGRSLLSRLTMKVNVVHRTLMARHKRLTKSGQSHEMQARSERN